MASIDEYRVPVSDYVGAVSESFPRTNRERIMEAAMDKRIDINLLPCNASNGGFSSDGYIEFIIPGSVAQFIDLSNIVLHLDGYVNKETDSGKKKVAEGDDVQLSNLAFSTLFRSVTVFLNTTQVESCTNFGYSSYLRTLLNVPKWRSDNLLKLMGYSELRPRDLFNSVTFASPSLKKNNMTEKGFHLSAPINLDVGTSDGYLLDSVDVRIRLELASDKFVINTSKPDLRPSIVVEEASLTVSKLKPMSNALASLNKQMEKDSVSYLFNRTLSMTKPISIGQTRISLDNPWGNVRPSKLWFVIVSMESSQGDYERNGLYFSDHKMSRVELSVDNEVLYSINTNFESKKYTNLYYQSMRGSGMAHEPIIDLEGFGAGEMVPVFSMVPEILNDSMLMEREGSLRLTIDLAEPPKENLLLMVFGDSQGVIRIDKERNVLLDIRA